MNTSLNHGSAKIYQFPAGGRSALGGRRYEDAKAVTDLASSRVERGCRRRRLVPRRGDPGVQAGA